MNDKINMRKQPETENPGDAESEGTSLQPKADSQVIDESQRLTVVGIGASAGGLTALQDFFDALPDNIDMAFVVVTHMDPERESILPELLQKHTRMPVQQVQGYLAVESNNVYVIPPNNTLIMTDSHLDLEDFEEPRGHRLPIDHFFRSLASVHKDTVAIILSGGGTDGAVGVKAVKEQGGLLMVQHPDEALHDSMPRAAINTGLADVVLPVRELAEKLTAYKRSDIQIPQDPAALTAEETETVYRILTQVQSRIGHDFSQYKRSTILRRIQRRMQIHGFATLDAYLGFLRYESNEAKALFNDLLIGVTNFFRDQEAWGMLDETIISRLFENKERGDTVRVWVIGCATGEEAYSLSILLNEYLDNMDRPFLARPAIQIFASDLDDVALHKARKGLYPEAIEADVSPERLSRFFVKEGNYYRVKQELRDTVLFSNHSILRDPPFSRLDLISCRNLLIYLQRELQKNVFRIFHYVLNPEGFLFLGGSESAEMVHQLFSPLDKTHRIYQARPWRGDFPEVPHLPLIMNRQINPGRKQRIGPDQRLVAENVSRSLGFHLDILEEAAPPSILVDDTYHIIHTSKSAGRFLLHQGGAVTADLLKLIRAELQFELRTALRDAFETKKQNVSHPIFVKFNGTPHRVTISIKPLSVNNSEDESKTEHLALIFFLEDEMDRKLPKSAQPKAGTDKSNTNRQEALILQLEGELQRLRERLQSISEEYESSNEELKAANEELQSINEEYRSTTEELETSKEELQSVNEELQTVNHELINKLEEVSRAHSDLSNLLASSEIATLFLDKELRIQRYTPSTLNLFNIMPGDHNRPISHLTHKLDYDNLAEDAQEVLQNLVPIEHEIQDKTGRQLLIRLRPYRTIDDSIDGVVLAFVDITTLRETERALERDRERYRLIAEGTTEYAMLTMDETGHIDSWNQGAERIFGYQESEVLGRFGNFIFTPEDQEARILEQKLILAKENGEADDDRWLQRKDGSRFWASGVLTALRDGKELRGFAKVMRDNTFRKAAEEELQKSEALYRELSETLEDRVQKRTAQVRRLASDLVSAEQVVRQRLAQVLHDDLQQVIYAIQIQISLLEGDGGGKLDELEEMCQRALFLTRQLTMELSPPVLDGEGIDEAMYWLAEHMEELYNLKVKVKTSNHPKIDEELSILLYQIMRELLFNVVKHAKVDTVLLTIEDNGQGLALTVSDNGKGFDVSRLSDEDGTGFGLLGIIERVELFGGNVTINSEPGSGTHITLFLPHEQSQDIEGAVEEE